MIANHETEGNKTPQLPHLRVTEALTLTGRTPIRGKPRGLGELR